LTITSAILLTHISYCPLYNKRYQIIRGTQYHINLLYRRSHWPHGLRRRSAASRFVVWCECWVLSGRGLCEGPITRTEESYRLCCFVVCDLGTSLMRRPLIALGRKATGQKIYHLCTHMNVPSEGCLVN